MPTVVVVFVDAAAPPPPPRPPSAPGPSICSGHFKGPARAHQSHANIFVFPSACVSSFGLGGPPKWLAPTTLSCAATAKSF